MAPRFHPPSRLVLAAQLGLMGITLLAASAHAQLVPSVGAASAAVEDPMQRAQRQADNVMRWIKVQSDKPRVNPAAPATAATTTPQPQPLPPPPALASAAAKAAAPKGIAPVAVAALVVAVPEPQKAEVATPPALEIPLAAPGLAAVTVPLVPAPASLVEEEEEIPLIAIAQPQPSIPSSVLSTLNTGKVMVRFLVEPNGKTSNIEIISSSSRKLNTPTITAVTDWRFQPIKVARSAQVEIDFLP